MRRDSRRGTRSAGRAPSSACPRPARSASRATRSAPLSAAAISRGTSAGSCEKSQSISRTSSAPSRERAPEPGDVRRPDPLLALAVEDAHPRKLGREPVGDLARAVGRRVVDHEHAVARRVEDLAERSDHRLEVLALVVGREAHDRPDDAGIDRTCVPGFAPQRPVPPPRRAPYDRRMPKALPRNGEIADQLDLLADLSEILDEEPFKVIAYRRAATRIRESPLPVAELALEGKAKELPGHREDHRGEGGRGGRARGDEGAHEAARPRPGRRRRLPAPARSRPEDRGSHLDGARRHDAGRAQGGCGGGAAARRSPGMGARSEEKILKALEAGAGEKPRAADAARRRASRRAARGRGARGASVRDRRLGGGKHPTSQGDRARPRPRGNLRRRRRRSSRPSAAAAGSPRSSPAATPRRPWSATTGSASTCAWCRPSATATSSSTSRGRRTTTSRSARRRSAAGSRSPSTA